MNKKLLKHFLISYFLLLLVGSTFFYIHYLKRSESYSIAFHNFVVIRDYASLKYIITPIFQDQLKVLDISDNNLDVFNLSESGANKNILLNFDIKIDKVNYHFQYKEFTFYIFLAILIFVSLSVSIGFYFWDIKSKIQQSLFLVSQKIAHDIRSPISTLNLISSKISDPEVKSLQISVVNQINAIANGLLEESKKNSFNANSIKNGNRNNYFIFRMPTSVKNKLSLSSSTNNPVVKVQRAEETLINSKEFFKDIEKEYLIKRTQMLQKLEILFKYYQMDNLNLTNDLSTIVYRAINNFVQNAIEATSENGTIVLKAELNDYEFGQPRFEISISDTGKGIPPHILKKLGHEKLSSGKEYIENNSGSGIALFHAKSDLQKHQCDLLIESELNKGTKIRILV